MPTQLIDRYGQYYDEENPLPLGGGRGQRALVTPTLSVAASYAANDYVGTSGVAMVFPALARAPGGTGVLGKLVVIDKAAQSIAGELWLFDATVTPPLDSAAWTVTDADVLRCVDVIPVSVWYASAANSVGVAYSGRPFKCNDGDQALYGCFVTRGAPSYANGDLTFMLTVVQD